MGEVISVKTFYAMGKFSRQQTDDMFLNFPRKYDLTLHADCLFRKSQKFSPL